VLWGLLAKGLTYAALNRMIGCVPDGGLSRQGPGSWCGEGGRGLLPQPSSPAFQGSRCTLPTAILSPARLSSYPCSWASDNLRKLPSLSAEARGQMEVHGLAAGLTNG